MAILIGEVVANMTGDTTPLDSSFNAAKTKGQQTADSIAASFDKLGAKFTAIGSKMSLYVTTPLTTMGGLALRSAGQMESLRTSLQTLTGSAEEGSRAFERLQRFAAETPFDTAELVKANNTLIGFGLNADQAYNSLRQIGDIAAVSGGDLGNISLAFGQVAAAGRLMGQDLLQLINNGVPIIDMLSKSMGVAKSEIKDLVSEGRVDFATLQKSFADATSEGGLFAGGMQKQSETINGLFSTLSDNANIALASIGHGIVDAFDLKRVIPALSQGFDQIVEWFNGLDASARRTLVYITAGLTALGPILVGISVLLKGIAIAAGVITSPVTLVIGAFAALSAAVLYIWDNWKAITERISDIAWWQNTLISMVQWVVKYNPFSFLAQSYVEMMALFGREVSNPFTVLADELDGLRMTQKTYENEFGSFMDAVKNGAKSIGNLFATAEEATDEIESMGGAITTVNAQGQQIPKWASTAMRPFVALREEIVAIADATRDINSILSGFSTNFEFVIPKGSIADLESQAASIQRLMTVATSPEKYAELNEQLLRVNEQIAIMNGSYEQTSPVLEAIQPVVDNFVNSFGQGMANIVVQGGKVVDILNNIGRLLLSSAIQQGISLLLSGGLSGTGFFGSGGGIFGALFGRGRAIGGPVNMMQPYIVGERGPELFVPQGAGNIVPTHMMNGGGQPVTVYVRGRISGKDIIFMQENGRRALR